MKSLCFITFLLIFSLTISAQNNKSQELFKNGFSLFQQGQYEQAILTFDDAININPQAFDAIYYRGIAKVILRKPLEAIFDFNAVIDRFPNMKGIEEAYQHRGVSYYFLKNHDKALADFEKAISINANYAEPYHGRANIFSDKGENEKALADYAKAVQLKPNLAAVYIDRAILYFSVGNFEGALKDYNKSIEMTPNVPSGYVDRGIIKGLGDDLSGAIDDIYQGFYLEKESVNEKPNESSTSSFIRLSKFIEQNPQNFRSFQVRAILRLFQGNKEEAQKDFQISEKLDKKLNKENSKILSEIDLIMKLPIEKRPKPKFYLNPRL